MDNTIKIERLKNHLEALESAYSKMILLLGKDMDTKKGEKDQEGDLSLRDSQIESFAKGTLKASEAANSLLIQIEEKEDAIAKLENPEEHKKVVEEKKDNEGSTSDLNRHLE